MLHWPKGNVLYNFTLNDVIRVKGLVFVYWRIILRITSLMLLETWRNHRNIFKNCKIPQNTHSLQIYEFIFLDISCIINGCRSTCVVLLFYITPLTWCTSLSTQIWDLWWTQSTMGTWEMSIKSPTTTSTIRLTQKSKWN